MQSARDRKKIETLFGSEFEHDGRGEWPSNGTSSQKWRPLVCCVGWYSNDASNTKGLGRKMTLAPVNGVNIWYEETGAGEPVVQIHGSGFGHLNFAAATPILSKRFHVVDFDLRGYGQSDQPIQHYDMEVWADDTAGLMDALSIPKAHIHGTSMGANVAQQFAAKYPDKVDHLILNCGAAKLDSAGILTRRNLIDVADIMGCGSRTLAELIAFQALSRSYLDSEQGQGAVDAIQDILEKTNRAEIFNRACQAVIDMDLRPLLPKISAPTLVIGGGSGHHDAMGSRAEWRWAGVHRTTH